MFKLDLALASVALVAWTGATSQGLTRDVLSVRSFAMFHILINLNFAVGNFKFLIQEDIVET